MGIWADFKKFASQGNFVTMAVGIVVGLAVSAVVMALVMDFVGPLIGTVLHANLANAGKVTVNGSTFLFGALLQALINFVVVLVVIFLFLVYPLAKMQERADARKAVAPPTQRPCPNCYSQIDVRATRCPFCTSEVTPTAPAPAAPAAA
jgi:large conductance mechanosensitive channel